MLNIFNVNDPDALEHIHAQVGLGVHKHHAFGLAALDLRIVYERMVECNAIELRVDQLALDHDGAIGAGVLQVDRIELRVMDERAGKVAAEEIALGDERVDQLRAVQLAQVQISVVYPGIIDYRISQV